MAVLGWSIEQSDPANANYRALYLDAFAACCRHRHVFDFDIEPHHDRIRRAGEQNVRLGDWTDTAVNNIKIGCAFSDREGRYTTKRVRTITETINMKSRKTFPRMLIGFVNVNAVKSKCTLLSADRM